MAAGTASAKAYGQHIESIRQSELPALESQVYLDSSGMPIVSRSVLDAVHTRLVTGPMVSNPHSNSPSGNQTREEIDRVRTLVCKELFNVERRGGVLLEESRECDPGWELVFSSGTTASLQIIAASFDFGGKGKFAYLEQSHSSLFGLRDVVMEKGDKGALGFDVLQEAEVVDWVKRQARAGTSSLLALPLQCNATGKRYNQLLSSVLQARKEAESRTSKRKVFILLDAASYLSPSTNLPLHSQSYHQPDFVCFSFLKILGYPSGLGGLLTLRQSGSILLAGKVYYGGGTLEAVTSRKHWKAPARQIHEALEDGTQNLFGIIAVKNAMETIRSSKVLQSWDQASDYVDHLTKYLWNSLTSLKHGNGSPLIDLYSDQPLKWKETEHEDRFHLPKQSQGPILLFNVLHKAINDRKPKRLCIDPVEVDRLACVENIHLRSGRMCNIGAVTRALQVDDSDIEALWERGIGCGSVSTSGTHCQDVKEDCKEEMRVQRLTSGCLRVSLSAWNTQKDLDTLLQFLQKYFVEKEEEEEEKDACAEGESDYESCDEVSVCCSIFHSGSSEIEEEEGSSQATSETSHSIHCQQQEEEEEKEERSDLYLKELYLYPIKSCALQPLTSDWNLTPTGLEYDRQFCIVDLANGKVMSQKQTSQMVLIHPRVCLESKTMSVSLMSPDGQLEMEEFTVALDSSTCSGKESRSSGGGYDMCGKIVHPEILEEDRIRETLSAFLGRDCTLARYPKGGNQIDQSRTPLLFSNESPYLLITSESVRQICSWIMEEGETGEDSVYANEENKIATAFRSNFIIASSSSSSSQQKMTCQPVAAFYEEMASRVRIGPHSFAVMGPCRRCQMIALDQTTGLPAPQVLRTVAKHCRCQSGPLKGRLLFGIHLLWRSQRTATMQGSVAIKVGMPVELQR